MLWEPMAEETSKLAFKKDITLTLSWDFVCKSFSCSVALMAGFVIHNHLILKHDFTKFCLLAMLNM
uniref:Uncharacterized protein n=1 Tax=Anguilla anguilla TaxID=7936 RepID=A0A0E9QXR4_ANGAN